VVASKNLQFREFLDAANEAADGRDYSRAEKLFQRALQKAQEQFGEASGHAALVLLSTIDFYESIDRQDKIEELKERITEMLQARLNENHH
jgi:thioredoxin-like negative regulator of GroEL